MAKFKAKPYQTGNSWAIIIPAQYISNGLIDVSKTLLVNVKEVDDGLSE